MSDDLISRRDAIVIIENMIFGVGKDLSKSYLLQDAKERIGRLNIAFDKEKVIEELVELRQKEYSDSDEESETIDGEEIYDEGRSQGRFEAYHRAIEIVEKGGIE